MSLRVQCLDGARQEQQWIRDCLASGASSAPQAALAVCQYAQGTLLLPGLQAVDAGIAARASQHGLPFLRRAGGGAAVLAGPWMVSAHVWLPAARGVHASLTSLRRRFSEAHCRALQACGMHAVTVTCDPPRPPEEDYWLKSVCFGQARTDELVDAEGRKLVGFSQHRGRMGTWIGSGVLVGRCDWPLLATVLDLPGQASARLVQSTAWCSAAPQRVLNEISEQLAASFADCGALEHSDALVPHSQRENSRLEAIFASSQLPV